MAGEAESGVGEALDFWRVTAYERDVMLRLRAEMRLPGTAALQFSVKLLPGGRSELTQTARFRPRGLFGLAYWYAVVPLHSIVFNGMLNGIRRAAERHASSEALTKHGSTQH